MHAEVAPPFIKRDGINWQSVTAFSVFHIGAVAALFFFTWPAFFCALGLYWVSLSLGIGMGYHRLLTHRSYKSPKWIEYFLAVCGTLALEGGPMFWVATHRVHHQFSDKHGDPHTPLDGKWWSHIVWMLVGDASHSNIDRCSRCAPDICKDRSNRPFKYPDMPPRRISRPSGSDRACIEQTLPALNSMLSLHWTTLERHHRRQPVQSTRLSLD